MEKKKRNNKKTCRRLPKYPVYIILGDMNVSVAQSKYKEGLLRIPFTESNDGRKILTVYWTSKIEKYMKGG